MSQIICSTCGTYYGAGSHPEPCTICLDERQYLPPTGQSWTWPDDLHRDHCLKLDRLKDRLYGFEINPHFAIGQRALLVLSDEGNVLWDCVPMLDEMTTAFIESKGGLRAIAISHPHYYSNMNDWAAAFDCPIYIHENDLEHVMVKGPQLSPWSGDELTLWSGMKLHLIGGHFAGSTILHVPFISALGAILCGDTLFLSPSQQHFSVVWSSPNRMPLPLSEMRRVKACFDALRFDEYYGYIRTQNLDRDVKRVLEASFSRYFADSMTPSMDRPGGVDEPS